METFYVNETFVKTVYKSIGKTEREYSLQSQNVEKVDQTNWINIQQPHHVKATPGTSTQTEIIGSLLEKIDSINKGNVDILSVTNLNLGGIKIIINIEGRHEKSKKKENH